MSLFDKTTQELREDYLRLVDVRLEVPDDEAVAGAVKEYGSDWHPKASLVLEMEPMSYRLTTDRDTDPNTNLHEVVRVPVTYSSGDKALTSAELQSIRDNGWLSIPEKKIVKLPRSLKGRDPSKLWLRYQRWACRAMNADFHLDINAEGQPFSNDIGQVFAVESGMDEFPRGNDETYGIWMSYITKRAPDYVAPPLNERDARVITTRDNEAGVAATAVASSGTVEASVLADAFEAAGFIGQSISKFASVEQQQAATSRAYRNAPVLGTDAVRRATDDGRLIDFAVEIGAIGVGSDGIIVRAE